MHQNSTDIRLRCVDCKHVFGEPEDPNGVNPGPLDKVACPSCGQKRMRMFYDELPSSPPQPPQSPGKDVHVIHHS